MTKSFKNIPSLHRLFESAPLGALQELIVYIDDGKFAASFADVPWPGDGVEEAAEDQVRQQILDIACELDTDTAAPLEEQAQRLLTLAEDRGCEVISQVAERIFENASENAFETQKDDYGRAIWLYVHHEELFEEAENRFYADHFRNFGKLYEAFEIDAEANADFVWSEQIKSDLEKKIKERLELKGSCNISHFVVEDGNANDGKGKHHPHLFIVRHGGPLSSVAAIREDGRKKSIYYRPLNEATMLFSPQENVIEVYAESPGIQPLLAAALAETGLKQDISARPLTFKQYNLSRFLTSLHLPMVSVEGFDIDRAGVVEAAAHPQNSTRRASLKVSLDDDIEVAASEEFGTNHVFQRAAAISRVVIAVRHTRAREEKLRTLNITLSDPNRCNLRSNRDPIQRDLGYALLEKWGILNRVRLLSMNEQKSIFPALLEIYDQRGKEVSGRFFAERGITGLDLLVEGGFVAKRGREKGYVAELDDGHTQTVTVVKSKTPGMSEYLCPQTHRPIQIPTEWMGRYEIKHSWVEERVVKGLQNALALNSKAILEGQLLSLGLLSLGGETFPTYLAIGLADPKIRDMADQLLRARHSAGFGIVFSAGKDFPPFLGANMVVWAGEYLQADGEEIWYDLDALKAAFDQSKILMAGATTVMLLPSPDKRSATLIIPGKAPWTVTGHVQMTVLKRLADAYPHPVATKHLRPHADETEASPPGPDKIYKRYENWRDYVVLEKKGYWRLNA